MGFTLLEDSIEMEVGSSKRFSTNIYTLVNLRSSLISTLETSRLFLSQSESFVHSSFTLSSDFNRIGLQFPSISSMTLPLLQFSREVNQLLPQTLRECKFLLDYTFENGIPFDHSEIFKSLKQEMDKFLVESNVQRKELRSLLLKYSKSSSDSTNDKIASTMAKLNQSIYQYEKYLMLIENELSEFVTRKHEFLFNLSKNIINLHHLIHFGKFNNNITDLKVTPLPSTTATTTNNNSITADSSSSSNNISNLSPTCFKDLLNVPIYLKAFRIFAEKQHCLENLLFWLDANTLKDLEDNKYPRNRVRSLFLNMYSNYISKDCKFEINIDSESKSLIENKRNSIDDDDQQQPFYSSLKLAVENIYQTLNLSMFPIFLQSPLYHSASTLCKSGLLSSSNSETCLTENRGVFHCINSVDLIIKNPITIEYFILFLRQLNQSSPSNSSGIHKSNSNTNISGLMSQLPNITDNLNSSSGNNNNNNGGIVPPLVLSLSPRLAPLITPFSVNSNTPYEIVNMVSFYLEINKFKETTDDLLLEMYAMDIYDIYLKPGSEKQITSIQYQKVLDMISSKSVTRDMFKNVALDILLHISYNYFQPFLNSNLCKEMLQREEKMKKYIDREEKKTKQDSKIDQQFEFILKEKFKLVIPSYKNYILTNNNSNNNSSGNSNSNSGFSSSNNSNNSNNNNIVYKQNTPTINNPYISNNSNNVSSSSSSNIGSSASSKSNNSSPILVSTPPSPAVGERIRSGVINMFSPSLTNLSINNSSNSSNNTHHHNHHHHNSHTSSVTISPLTMSGSGSSSNSSSVQGYISPRTSNDGSNSSQPSSPHTSLFENETNEIFTFILNDPNWLDAFKKYVKSEKCEEILLFWLEVESFLTGSKSKSVAAATNIYETFIREGSPLEVNIEYDIRSQCKSSLTKQSDEDIDHSFRSAAHSVLEMIKVGSYKNFLKSQLFKEMVSQLGDPTKLKTKKK